MHKIKKFLHRNIYPFLFRFLPLNNRKVVLSSFAGKRYSDNPRAISEMLYKKNPKVEIVWLMNNAKNAKGLFPNYVKVVENESFAAAYELFTAKVWVDNTRKPLFFKKRKETFYVQTWHGTPLKLIENDAGDNLGRRYIKYAKRDSENMDVLISGNKYSTKIFRKAFCYTGRIIECGTPRNDILISMSIKMALSVREELKLTDKKIILYAPTFRNDMKKNGIPQIELLNPIALLNVFEKKYKCEFILLTRFHPNVAENIQIKELSKIFGEKVLDVSSYHDVQKLLCVSDVLITDFSSIFFDYSLLRRPIILFTPDENDYIEERGFYLKTHELPILSASTSDELVKLIEEHDIVALSDMTNELLNMIGNVEDGNSSEIISELLIEVMKT